jgi:penicillin-binding protein 2
LSSLFNDPQHPLFDRAISGSFPPGSVFKMVAAAAGLEKAKITPDTVFTCTGALHVGNRDFKCWGTHGDQDLTQAIAHSCDVYFYKTGLAVGAQVLHDYAQRFGLARPTGIELPYETSGFVPNPIWKRLKSFQSWYDGDTANLVIGQGETLTTPLQLCRMMAIFANGGQLVRPYIVRAIDGKEVWQQHRRISPVGLRKETMQAIRLGLREVVAGKQGTASMLSDAPVAIAGKTGTAEINKVDAHAWFAGFFPFPSSKYAICVFIERGGHGYAASMLAKRIITSLYEEDLL